jgi:hypothetical protein
MLKTAPGKILLMTYVSELVQRLSYDEGLGRSICSRAHQLLNVYGSECFALTWC